jgi:uncharacterized protein (TIGR00255 family)
MVRSMTGFGSGTATESGWRAELTIRSWNHRYLSVRTRALGDRPLLQARVDERIKAVFRRGEVGVWVDLQPDRSAQERSLYDLEGARAAYKELQALAEILEIEELPSLETLVRAGGLQPAAEAEADMWPAVSEALELAVEAVLASREREGAGLAVDLARLIGELEARVSTVERRLPDLTTSLRERLAERIEEMAVNVDQERLEAEIALLAERHDVQEELVRLRGHITRARALLETDKPIGKELDFLSQELLREVNTIGSKARDAEVGGLVIEMKLCVEQFREQVQNVE